MKEKQTRSEEAQGNNQGKVMIVAAEASSGLFAQRLLEFWKNEGRKIEAFGVGTREMETLGFERLGRSEEMAVVGATEIFENFSLLKKVFYDLVEAAKVRRPDVVLVMDYPEFNLYLSRKLFHLGIRVVYYVTPQVWAWRKGRVQTIKRFCEKALVLFPFEAKFFEAAGVPVEFVGHPILDELKPEYDDLKFQNELRARFGIRENDIVLALMPGSRRGELAQHLPQQLRIAEKLCHRFPQLKVQLLIAPTRQRADYEPYLEKITMPLILLNDDPFRMIAQSDIVLVASGTATLMVGLLAKPMVIMYRMKWLTSLMVKLVVRGVKFFGLVNLVAGREIVPERFQGRATDEELERLLVEFIVDEALRRKTQEDLYGLRHLLGDRGATSRVAKTLESYFSR